MAKAYRNSQAQERWVAALLKGYKTRASGALEQKGDVIVRHVMCECKDTDKTEIILKFEDWKKVVHDAGLDFKEPMMHLRMRGLRVFVVSEDFLEEIFFHAGADWDCYYNIHRDCAGRKTTKLSSRCWELFSGFCNASPILLLDCVVTSLNVIEEGSFAPLFVKALEKMPRRFDV